MCVDRLELGHRTQAPMGLHYKQALEVAKQGEVAVVIVTDGGLATFAFNVKQADRRWVFHRDEGFRVAALLLYMQEAHRQLAERI